jgi:hypothetical protein
VLSDDLEPNEKDCIWQTVQFQRFRQFKKYGAKKKKRKLRKRITGEREEMDAVLIIHSRMI